MAKHHVNTSYRSEFRLTKDIPYIASRASYGVSIVKIWEIIDRVITALHSICIWRIGVYIDRAYLKQNQHWPCENEHYLYRGKEVILFDALSIWIDGLE